MKQYLDLVLEHGWAYGSQGIALARKAWQQVLTSGDDALCHWFGTATVFAVALGQPIHTSLALGMILALSSTAIVLQTLAEKGLMKNPAGQSSFVVLLFQDIAVIPVLAFFPLLATLGNPAGQANHGPQVTDAAGTHCATQTWVSTLDPALQTLVVLGAELAIVLAAATVGRMVAVVALTMAMTPLLMMVNERLILPRLSQAGPKDRAADTIHDQNQIIIAGFDEFGVIIGRLLKANGIASTVLDSDPDRVEILRKLGLRVYYGDASRHELLEAAGADKAKLIIITFDEPEKSLNLVNLVQKHFPNLKILVRAIGRPDAYQLLNQDLRHVYRDRLDTALRVGVEAMKLLGLRAYKAHRAAQTFF